MTENQKKMALRAVEIALWAAVFVALATEIAAAAKAALIILIVAIVFRFVFRGGFTHRAVNAFRDKAEA